MRQRQYWHCTLEVNSLGILSCYRDGKPECCVGCPHWEEIDISIFETLMKEINPNITFLDVTPDTKI